MMIDFELWLDAELKKDWLKRTGGKDKPLPKQLILPIGSNKYELEVGGNTIKKSRINPPLTNAELLLAAHERELDNLALTSALNVKDRNTRGRETIGALGYLYSNNNNVEKNKNHVALFSAPSSVRNIPIIDTRYLTSTVYESKYREFAQSIIHFSDCLTTYICALSQKDVTLQHN